MSRGPSERCRMEGDTRNENGKWVKEICVRMKGEKVREREGEREKVGVMEEKRNKRTGDAIEWESEKENDLVTLSNTNIVCLVTLTYRQIIKISECFKTDLSVGTFCTAPHLPIPL